MNITRSNAAIDNLSAHHSLFLLASFVVGVETDDDADAFFASRVEDWPTEGMPSDEQIAQMGREAWRLVNAEPWNK